MVDSQNTLTCPACGCEMEKVFIAEKGINIDICTDGCGGMFFDNKEIQEFSEYNDNIDDIKNALLGKNFMPVDESKTRICPSCGTPMTKTYALKVQIDTCYKCGGMFLDYGEFDFIRSKFKKYKKVEQLDLHSNSEFSLEEYYREAQREEHNFRKNNSVINFFYYLFKII